MLAELAAAKQESIIAKNVLQMLRKEQVQAPSRSDPPRVPPASSYLSQSSGSHREIPRAAEYNTTYRDVVPGSARDRDYGQDSRDNVATSACASDFDTHYRDVFPASARSSENIQRSHPMTANAARSSDFEPRSGEIAQNSNPNFSPQARGNSLASIPPSGDYSLVSQRTQNAAPGSSRIQFHTPMVRNANLSAGDRTHSDATNSPSVYNAMPRGNAVAGANDAGPGFQAPMPRDTIPGPTWQTHGAFAVPAAATHSNMPASYRHSPPVASAAPSVTSVDSLSFNQRDPRTASNPFPRDSHDNMAANFTQSQSKSVVENAPAGKPLNFDSASLQRMINTLITGGGPKMMQNMSDSMRPSAASNDVARGQSIAVLGASQGTVGTFQGSAGGIKAGAEVMTHLRQVQGGLGQPQGGVISFQGGADTSINRVESSQVNMGSFQGGEGFFQGGGAGGGGETRGIGARGQDSVNSRTGQQGQFPPIQRK